MFIKYINIIFVFVFVCVSLLWIDLNQSYMRVGIHNLRVLFWLVPEKRLFAGVLEST